MASRTKARELALQMLFQWEVGKHPTEEVLQTFLGKRRLDPETGAFARDLFKGVVEGVSQLDQLIREHATHWKVERMAVIDRNILRLGVYEIIHFPETPPAVVINEAIEIARRFSGEDSVEFVNCVLDAIHKSLATNLSGHESSK